MLKLKRDHSGYADLSEFIGTGATVDYHVFKREDGEYDVGITLSERGLWSTHLGEEESRAVR